jgi:hypothetical protein
MDLNPEAIYNWLISKGMNKPHAEELKRCIEVTKIVDEDIIGWKKKHGY